MSGSVIFVPHSRVKLAKGLILNELVPADDVRVATEALRAIKQLDMSTAREKWNELANRMLRYGDIRGSANIEAVW